MSAALDQDYRAATWQLYRACIEAQSRDELVAECHQRGSIARSEWHQFVAEYGITTAKAFVENCERVQADLWRDRVASILESFCTAPVDAA